MQSHTTISSTNGVPTIARIGTIPVTLVGLGVIILGWIMMALAILPTGMALFSVAFVIGGCLLVGGLCTMLWAEG